MHNNSYSTHENFEEHAYIKREWVVYDEHKNKSHKMVHDNRAMRTYAALTPGALESLSELLLASAIRFEVNAHKHGTSYWDKWSLIDNPDPLNLEVIQMYDDA